MRITTKGRYGLRAVIRLVKTQTDNPVPIRYIAEQEEISPEFLEQIFFKLKKAGIIESTRGAGGGFRLTRDPGRVSILEILDAVGEDINLSPCEKLEDCLRSENCTTYSLWAEGTKLIRDFFGKISLNDILNECF